MVIYRHTAAPRPRVEQCHHHSPCAAVNLAGRMLEHPPGWAVVLLILSDVVDITAVTRLVWLTVLIASVVRMRARDPAGRRRGGQFHDISTLSHPGEERSD